MDNPTMAFGLEYAGELIFCEAVMHDGHYEIFFDGKPMATIEHTEDWDWMQATGRLLTWGVVQEIGVRIESYYK